MTPGAGAAVADSGAQESLLASVGAYYSEKIRQYGATPLGVDWSCVPTQEMRFVQLLKLCDFSIDFSLNDVGCGYGALLQYLTKRHRRRRVEYFGTDVSEEMIGAAVKQWSSRRSARFSVGSDALQPADYSVASGVFNVKLDSSNDAWELLIQRTLDCMHGASRKGFAVNFLFPPTHLESGVPELYYAKPERWASYCESQLAANVEVLAGYGLKEYTLLMRRSA